MGWTREHAAAFGSGWKNEVKEVDKTKMLWHRFWIKLLAALAHRIPMTIPANPFSEGYQPWLVGWMDGWLTTDCII